MKTELDNTDKFINTSVSESISEDIDPLDYIHQTKEVFPSTSHSVNKSKLAIT